MGLRSRNELGVLRIGSFSSACTTSPPGAPVCALVRAADGAAFAVGRAYKVSQGYLSKDGLASFLGPEWRSGMPGALALSFKMV
jgi:hypothetical protein